MKASLRATTRGFTLVEMLLATTLAAVLIGGVLTATAALSRDRRRMESKFMFHNDEAGIEVLRRDLAAAKALVGTPTPIGFELIGYGAIDRRSRLPSQRLARVRYHVAGELLIREQAYLDDAIRPDAWSDVMATGVKRIELIDLSADDMRVRLSEEMSLKVGGGSGERMAMRLPSRLRIRIERRDGVIDREMVLR